jgi:hypothetical protein
MPKLKNVTADDLRVLLNELDAIGDVGDYTDRIQKGYVDDGVATLRDATDLLRASRACADLAAQLLFRLRLEEDRAETRKLVEAQLAGKE